MTYDRCKKPTVYERTNNAAKEYPVCVYYDAKNDKCTLNACIRRNIPAFDDKSQKK